MAKKVYTAAQVAAVAARIGMLPGYTLAGVTIVNADTYLLVNTTDPSNGAAVKYVAKCSPGTGGSACVWIQTPYQGRPLVDPSIAICPPTIDPITCSL